MSLKALKESYAKSTQPVDLEAVIAEATKIVKKLKSSDVDEQCQSIAHLIGTRETMALKSELGKTNFMSPEQACRIIVNFVNNN